MAAFDFPESPSLNDTYTENGVTFKWNGVLWRRVGDFGAQGIQGVQGPQGVQGTQGIGFQGSQGTQGNQGLQGNQGNQGLQGNQGNQGTISNFQGTQGTQGNQGNQGLQGLQGTQGRQGVQGGIGVQGAKGDSGGTGTQGAKGSQGTQGNQSTQGSKGNQGTIGSTTFAVPQGGIIMWSGAISAIPSGWVLCDGNNNTPDLRTKFIVGAGTDTANTWGFNLTAGTDTFTNTQNYPSVGATGGETAHKLSTPELASHTHDINNQTSTGPSFVAFSTLSTNPSSTNDNTGYQSGAGSFGDDRLFTIENEGSGWYHENRPPYYALAYIMKT